MPPYNAAPLSTRILRGTGALASGVFNAIDLPGSMVRDTLALRNPFDQVLDPFGGSNRSTGRDVARRWGLASERDTWLNFGPGLAMEIATDPLNAVTFGGLRVGGALGKTGQVVEKAGVLDEALRAATHASDARLPTMGRRQAVATLTPNQIDAAIPGSGQAMRDAAERSGVDYASIADTPLGGFAGVSTGQWRGWTVPKPFGEPTQIVGHGAQSRLMPLMKALDKAEETVRWSAAGRTAAGLFDKSVRGLATRTGQETAQRFNAAAERVFAKTRESAAPYIRLFEEAGIFDDAAKEMEVWRALEGVSSRKMAPQGGPTGIPNFRPQFFSKATGRDISDEMNTAIGNMRSAMRQQFDQEIASGLSTTLLDDHLIDYFPRSPQLLSGAWSRGYAGSRRVLPVAHPFQRRRNDAVRNVAGGTATLNKLSMDPRFSGIVHSTPPDQLTKEFWEDQVEALKRSPLMAEINPKGTPIPKRMADVSSATETSDEQLMALVKWAGYIDPQHAAKQIPVYQSPIVSFLRRIEYGQNAIAGAEISFDMLNRAAREVAEPGDIRLTDVLEGIGLDKNATSRMNDMLANRGLDTTKAWIPKEIAADVNRLMVPFRNPDEVGALLEYVVDPLTAMFKGSVTGIWPAFHSRNFTSGQVQNLLARLYRSPKSGGAAVKDMDRMVRGGAIEDAAKLVGDPNLTPQEATDKLAEMMFSHGVIGKHGIQFDVQAAAGDAARAPNIAKEIPGLYPSRPTAGASARAAWEKLRKNTWNPLKQRGAGSIDNEFAPAAVGDDAAHYVESMNRGAPFIDLLRQGYSPEEAAKRVRAAQVDYSNASEFEKMWMKRLFPFYSFSKGMATFLADELMSRPGGLFGQAIRVTERLRGQDEGTPEYVAQTSSINLGRSEDGTATYVTGLGLMHEDPLSLGGIRNGMPSLADTGTELLSRLNPLIKAPLEMATGESFFQRGPLGGRDLADMDPTVGRILANVGLSEETPSGRAKPFLSATTEHLLANSPLSRLLSTVRTVTDPRKREGIAVPGDKLLLRLATGVGVSDISPGAQDAVIREKLFAKIRESGGSIFERAYFPAGEELTEGQQEMNALAKLLAARAKERAKAKQAAAATVQ